MSPLQSLHARLTHEELPTATLIGVVAIPCILLENLLFASGPISGDVSSVSLFLACVATGYVYAERETEARWACEQTAAIGMLAVGFFWAVEYVGALGSGWATPLAAALFGAVVVLLWVLVVVLLGLLSAFLGKWLHRGVRRVRPRVVGA
jgi:hypothetical protein